MSNGEQSVLAVGPRQMWLCYHDLLAMYTVRPLLYADSSPAPYTRPDLYSRLNAGQVWWKTGIFVHFGIIQ